MTLALGILAFFLILATLILVHELGHFVFAKSMGVRVDEFGLGFPPRLKAWRRGQTTYSLNIIPLGGFVRMLGENGETDRPDSFGAKAPWQRLLILLAGPGMNLLLALAIYFFTFVSGTPKGLTIVTQVQPGSPAALAGLNVGDRISAVNGISVKYFDDLVGVVDARAGRRVTLVVQRGHSSITTQVVPRLNPPPNQGRLGVELGKTVTVSYAPATALSLSFDSVGTLIASVPLIPQALSQSHGSGVSGPIGIAHITTSVVGAEPRQGPGIILQWMALLSATLGVLNLLPIPALDGGRIFFVLVSWARRRNLDPEVEGLMHMVGMAALLTLILFVSYQDIARWVTGGQF
jgi:regulator of sigma E protease